MAVFHVEVVLLSGSRENPRPMMKVHRLVRKRRVLRAAHLMGIQGKLQVLKDQS